MLLFLWQIEKQQLCFVLKQKHAMLKQMCLYNWLFFVTFEPT